NCGDKRPGSSASGTRRPGVIIPGHLRAMLVAQHRTLRSVGGGRAGQIWLVRLLPFARRIVFVRRRNVHAMMHPAMPAGRNGGSLGITVIDHPAPRLAVGVDSALVI